MQHPSSPSSTSSSSSGEDKDIERFIRSFRGETSEEDVIAPGASYIQFFVEPSIAVRSVSASRESADRPLESASEIVVGTTTTGSGEEKEDKTASVVAGCFGALSSQGMFLASSGSSFRGGRRDDATPERELSTKIDAPNCLVETLIPS